MFVFPLPFLKGVFHSSIGMLEHLFFRKKKVDFKQSKRVQKKQKKVNITKCFSSFGFFFHSQGVLHFKGVSSKKKIIFEQTRLNWCFNNPQANMVFVRKPQLAFKDSMIHKFCNSHYLSHFATFFIDTRAKRSTVDSCMSFF